MPWPFQRLHRLPLAKEITTILIVKVALILTIRWLWFSSAPPCGPAEVSTILLSGSVPSPSPLSSTSTSQNNQGSFLYANRSNR